MVLELEVRHLQLQIILPELVGVERQLPGRLLGLLGYQGLLHEAIIILLELIQMDLVHHVIVDLDQPGPLFVLELGVVNIVGLLTQLILHVAAQALVRGQGLVQLLLASSCLLHSLAAYLDFLASNLIIFSID